MSAPGSERLTAALRRLYALAPGGMKPGLTAMSAACAEHVHVEEAFPVLQACPAHRVMG